MKIEVNKQGDLSLKEVYNSIELETKDGEILSICMRDSGFEFTYGRIVWEAKGGRITQLSGEGLGKKEPISEVMYKWEKFGLLDKARNKAVVATVLEAGKDFLVKNGVHSYKVNLLIPTLARIYKDKQEVGEYNKVIELTWYLLERDTAQFKAASWMVDWEYELCEAVTNDVLNTCFRT